MVTSRMQSVFLLSIHSALCRHTKVLSKQDNSDRSRVLHEAKVDAGGHVKLFQAAAPNQRIHRRNVVREVAIDANGNSLLLQNEAQDQRADRIDFPSSPVTASEWGQAQEHMGLLATSTSHPAQLAAWNARKRGTWSSGGLTYVMQDKCGSEAITANIKVWAALGGSARHQCRFTFVREPIDRFVSAYVEFEQRFSQAQQMNLTLVASDNFSFHLAPLGSVDRAEAFLKDLLGMQWISTGMQVNGVAVNSSPSPLFYKSALLHLFPLAPQVLVHWPLQVIGNLESFQNGWAKVCDCIGGKIPFNLSLHHHSARPNSQVRNAMLKLVARRHVRQALCLIYRQDYELFGYKCHAGPTSTLMVRGTPPWWD